MAQDLSFEDPEAYFFITIRTIGSKLWFVNNEKLVWYILAFLAKYQETYGVLIYGFVLMGNHWHLIARFPRGNKTAFLKAFNAIVAKLVNSQVKTFYGGRLWARRARVQVLAEPADVEHWTLYAALNPVSSGLVERCSDYPGYNSFSDAIHGKERTFKLVDWSDYNNRKRTNRALTKAECTRTYTLTYSRLPRYEHLAQEKYTKGMLQKAEKRRFEIVQERRAEGKGFAGRDALLKTKPGAVPHSTKKAERHTKRPLVLSLSPEAREILVDRYFRLLAAYREASRRFRAGELTVEFPPGTHRPPLFTPI